MQHAVVSIQCFVFSDQCAVAVCSTHKETFSLIRPKWEGKGQCIVMANTHGGQNHREKNSSQLPERRISTSQSMLKFLHHSAKKKLGNQQVNKLRGHSLGQ